MASCGIAIRSLSDLISRWILTTAQTKPYLKSGEMNSLLSAAVR